VGHDAVEVSGGHELLPGLAGDTCELVATSKPVFVCRRCGKEWV
jgi:hypothetical protein